MPNLVEPELYIGDLNDAVQLKSSNDLNIKVVFSIGIFPTLDKCSSLTYHNIEVADLPSEDLLSHFDNAIELIKVSKSTGAVLVHCYHGVSRSATVITAYIMKQYDMPLESAIAKLVRVRDVVAPNEGFLQQLTLYARMNTRLDNTFIPYKLYRLKKLSKIVKDVRLVPSCHNDVIKADPGLQSNKPNPNVYKCKKCRRVLFNLNHVFEHNKGDKVSWKLYADSAPEQQEDLCREKIFIEPLAWMKDIKTNPSGKLVCPRCSFKLGSYSWVEYCVCSCRSKIFPFFYVTPSRIDYDNVVKNVQVTI